jgi:assimilatory nitrate reductase catalytic subunit
MRSDEQHPSRSASFDLSSLLHQRDGRLTRELLRAPGGFGLGQVPESLRPDATTNMVCGYCSTGCGLTIHLRGGEAISLSPTTEYPVNLGMACPKGWESLAVLAAPDRGTTPLLRTDAGRFAPVTWSHALDTFVARFRAIQAEYGAEATAFLGTGQIVTEEMALLGALAKFGMGMIHGDGNTRQCMATSVVAYKQAFGFDAPPYTYRDFEESDVLVLVGSNLCIAHPILWESVLRNPHQPEIVVVDPRRTETAMQATRHFAIAPKSDLDFFYGLAAILIENGWIDRPFIDAHTTGFDEFAAHLRSYSPERAAEVSGIDVERIHALARTIHQGRRVSFWWTMGVNQGYQAVRTAQSLINLALITGNLGRPGTGANSITGQCNAMGSRLFSNTTNLMGGHDFENAGHRAKIAKTLDIPVERIPARNSWAYPEIISGILKGKIKGLWVIATNPVHSWINQSQVRDILGRLEFLVVQDMYHTTETAQVADLYLPAAGWGEKDGTFINSERRIGLVKKVARAPGEALADFSIFKLIAQAWGCGEMFREWDSPEAVFQILKRVSAGQPCDITGIRDYRMLDEAGGIQWPFPTGSSAVETHRRLFADGRFFHPDGRARLLFEDTAPMPEPPSDAYPLLLLTGRGSASQWHTQTRTGKSAVLNKLAPRSVYVEISPTDADRAGIAQNEIVVVETQRGTLQARAFVTNSVSPGQVFLPMHYHTVNQLTDAVFDPYSRQPSYKACAARIRKLETVA